MASPLTQKSNQARRNATNGKFLEELFQRQAFRNGLIPIKNYLTARYIFKNKYKVMKSDLDYKLIDPKTGRVGWFDMKYFSKDFFTFSDINPDQIERAMSYRSWKIPSGFVCMFSTKEIVFFTASQIVKSGPRTRFLPGDGLLLGQWGGFDLRPIMAVI